MKTGQVDMEVELLGIVPQADKFHGWHQILEVPDNGLAEAVLEVLDQEEEVQEVEDKVVVVMEPLTQEEMLLQELMELAVVAVEVTVVQKGVLNQEDLELSLLGI